MQNDNEKFKNEFKDRLYKFVLRLIKFLAAIPRNQITVVVVGQALRSGTSILANYIEARASSSRKEFTLFFQHSLKSANETGVWLMLLRDTNNGEKLELSLLSQELNEIAKIFASSVIKLKNKK